MTTKKWKKKKNRERERSNILCVRTLCTEGERELEIYNKKSQKIKEDEGIEEERYYGS